MAPEIHENKKYDGKVTDLFASMVILFVIHVGTPPFTQATMDEPWYKTIASKNYDKFWKAHARGKDKDFASPDF